VAVFFEAKCGIEEVAEHATAHAKQIVPRLASIEFLFDVQRFVTSFSSVAGPTLCPMLEFVMLIAFSLE